jgi:two-component sensor histidine kinase
MPPLFIFAFTAERKLDHQMQEMAARKEHARSTAEWAEQKHSENVRKIAANREAAKDLKTEEQLLELYRESVAKSGVRVVPGEALGLHHKISNAFADHPFKILAGVGVPAVAWIFYGRTGQEHLQLQMKVMHTRVMGQFTVITMLLSLMGFKSYMDHYGKFITEAEADRRVEEMRLVREDLLTRLELEKAHRAEIEGELRQAHEVDVQKGQVHDKKQKKTKVIKSIETVGISSLNH